MGTSPVNDFIGGLPVEHQEELDYTISLLNRLRPTDPPFRSRTALRSVVTSESFAATTGATSIAFSTGDLAICSCSSTPSRSGQLLSLSPPSRRPKRVGGFRTADECRSSSASRRRKRRAVRSGHRDRVIISDNFLSMTKKATVTSPVGSTAQEASERRATHSGLYREQQAERSGFREIAWLLIKYRMEAGLSQQALAERFGTSHSQISRIESGRHRTNLDTLQRIAAALDRTLLVGFERRDAKGRSKRDFVAV